MPGIERFGGTRLRDLERSGPRTLRTLWGAAREDLETRYGDVTIGMLLDEYERDVRRRGARPEPLTAGRSPPLRLERSRDDLRRLAHASRRRSDWATMLT